MTHPFVFHTFYIVKWIGDLLCCRTRPRTWCSVWGAWSAKTNGCRHRQWGGWTKRWVGSSSSLTATNINMSRAYSMSNMVELANDTRMIKWWIRKFHSRWIGRFGVCLLVFCIPNEDVLQLISCGSVEPWWVRAEIHHAESLNSRSIRHWSAH